MKTRVGSIGLVLLVGLVLGCGGAGDGGDGVQPPPDPVPDIKPAPMIGYGARVAITASGPFVVEREVVRLVRQSDAGDLDTITECTWLGTTDVAAGQRHAYDCGVIVPEAGVRDQLASLGVTFENLVESGAVARVTHELTVSQIEIELVQATVDGEQGIDGQTCELNERVGRAAGDTALPNLLRVQFGGGACGPVIRERYLNTIWLAISGTPRDEYKKYLFAGQDPGGRPLVGGFSSQTYIAFDFVTPAVPAADAMVFASVANMPNQGSYDSWVLSGVSLRTGSGMTSLDLALTISCTGQDGDASQITCWTDGHDLACSTANLCNL